MYPHELLVVEIASRRFVVNELETCLYRAFAPELFFWHGRRPRVVHRLEAAHFLQHTLENHERSWVAIGNSVNVG